MSSKNDQKSTIKEEDLFWQDVENKELDVEELRAEFKEGEIADFNMMDTKKDRRSFLKIMGFSFSALPLASCIKIPVKKALPYLDKHNDVVPGVANWYATSMNPLEGSALLVKTREGRPIKIEGNPLSPFHRGGTSAYCQGSLLSLYDSSRYHGPMINGEDKTWDQVDSNLINELKKISKNGEKIYLVTGEMNSPSLLQIVEKFKKQYKTVEHIVYSPHSMSSLLEAHYDLFGVRSYPQINIEKADYVLSFEADFLGTWLSPVEFTKQYSEKRDVLKQKNILKHLQLESMMTLTGSNADIRLTLSQQEQKFLIVNILAFLQKTTGQTYLPMGQKLPKSNIALAQKISQELLEHKGKSVVLSGSHDKSVQVMVAAINHLLGNYDKTIKLVSDAYFKGANDKLAYQAFEQMQEGKAGAVLFWDANPIYDYFHGEQLEKGLKKIPVRASFSTWPDETSALCTHLLPDNYYLESWRDYFSGNGTLLFSQPVIQPLFGSRMAPEFFLRAIGEKDYYSFLKENTKNKFFSRQNKLLVAEDFWNRSIHDGVAELNYPWPTLKINKAKIPEHFSFISKEVATKGFELVAYQSVAMRIGKLGNNPWLHELPDPITKVTWDNYILISPKVARTKGLKTGSLVRLTKGKRSLDLPVVLQPGMSDQTIAVAVGYGHKVSGKVGKNVGENIYPFISYEKETFYNVTDQVEIKPLGRKVILAQTQTHHSMEGRNLVRQTSLDEYLKNPKAGNEETIKLISLWGKHEKTGHQWGMVVDLNKCTGCSGCIISCNSENNVPVVGKEEVANRREMHWLRIDRYYKGDESNPEVFHQPVMCQHCDNAPCETVCPVLATVQSSDGLNQQVYNRCVGTRYCANNCPYKVRRFNWFDYPHNDKNENMVLNPDIVVRSRGVMEKCSMCIQRIQESRLQAKKEGRAIKDGEIKLACQQSCPGDAIVFGDLNDPKSKVSQLLNHPRNYRLLEEINVQPRVSYLTRVRNKE